MSDVIYRLGTEEDFPAVSALYVKLHTYFREIGLRLPTPDDVGAAWLDSFRRTLGRYSSLHVAVLDGEVVSFILTRIKQVPPFWGGVTVGILSDMWVRTKARRLGVGRKLSHIGLKWLQDQGVHSVEIQVLLKNNASWGLYEDFGFEPELRQSRLLWEDYSPNPQESPGAINSPEVIYRLASEEDFSAVSEMYSELDALMRRMGMRLPGPENVGQAWVDSFSRTIGRYSFLHVVEVDNELVGFLLSRIKRVPPYWGGVIVGEITDLWLHPKVRRLHLAEQLANEGIKNLRDQEVHSVEAHFLITNEPVWRLAESIGFNLETRTARLLWKNYNEEEDE
ncbi:MAG: GNAT family N-acetyltransferase [Chloroflexota bacterium]